MISNSANFAGGQNASPPGLERNLSEWTQGNLFDIGPWRVVSAGDPVAFRLASRHYSFRRYRDGRRSCERYSNRKRFVGIGESITLLGTDERSIFVWLKSRYSVMTGVCCALFRNESTRRSSDLILAAEEFAWRRWPGERLYTYVNRRRIRSANPGCCFKKARWQVWGESLGGLIILEKCPAALPASH